MTQAWTGEFKEMSRASVDASTVVAEAVRSIAKDFMSVADRLLAMEESRESRKHHRSRHSRRRSYERYDRVSYSHHHHSRSHSKSLSRHADDRVRISR